MNVQHKTSQLWSGLSASRILSLVVVTSVMTACLEMEETTKPSTGTFAGAARDPKASATTAEARDFARETRDLNLDLERDKLANTQELAALNNAGQTERAVIDGNARVAQSANQADAQKTAAMWNVAGTLGGATMQAVPQFMAAKTASRQVDMQAQEQASQRMRVDLQKAQAELNQADEARRFYEGMAAGKWSEEEFLRQVDRAEKGKYILPEDAATLRSQVEVTRVSNGATTYSYKPGAEELIRQYAANGSRHYSDALTNAASRVADFQAALGETSEESPLAPPSLAASVTENTGYLCESDGASSDGGDCQQSIDKFKADLAKIELPGDSASHVALREAVDGYKTALNNFKNFFEANLNTPGQKNAAEKAIAALDLEIKNLSTDNIRTKLGHAKGATNPYQDLIESHKAPNPNAVSTDVEGNTRRLFSGFRPNQDQALQPGGEGLSLAQYDNYETSRHTQIDAKKKARKQTGNSRRLTENDGRDTPTQ